MGLAALAALLYTGGNVETLVIMYSINVFVTFSLSMLGMLMYTMRAKRASRRGKRKLALYSFGLILCGTILVITTLEKFTQGGWVTLLVTGGVVFLCFGIRRHYENVSRKVAKLYVDWSIQGMRDRHLFTKVDLAGDVYFDLEMRRVTEVDLIGRMVVRGAIVDEGPPRIVKGEGAVTLKSQIRGASVEAAAGSDE